MTGKGVVSLEVSDRSGEPGWSWGEFGAEEGEVDAETAGGVVGVEAEEFANLAHAVGERVAVDAETFRGGTLGAAMLKVDEEGFAELAATVFAEEVADDVLDIATLFRRSPLIVEQAECAKLDIVVEVDFVGLDHPALLEASDVPGLANGFRQVTGEWDGGRDGDVGGRCGAAGRHHDGARAVFLDGDDFGDEAIDRPGVVQGAEGGQAAAGVLVVVAWLKEGHAQVGARREAGPDGVGGELVGGNARAGLEEGVEGLDTGGSVRGGGVGLIERALDAFAQAANDDAAEGTLVGRDRADPEHALAEEGLFYPFSIALPRIIGWGWARSGLFGGGEEHGAGGGGDGDAESEAGGEALDQLAGASVAGGEFGNGAFDIGAGAEEVAPAGGEEPVDIGFEFVGDDGDAKDGEFCAGRRGGGVVDDDAGHGLVGEFVDEHGEGNARFGDDAVGHEDEFAATELGQHGRAGAGGDDPFDIAVERVFRAGGVVVTEDPEMRFPGDEVAEGDFPVL